MMYPILKLIFAGNKSISKCCELNYVEKGTNLGIRIGILWERV